MARESPSIVKMNRQPPGSKDRANQADRSATDRHSRERRSSGEGSESALANLRNIERDRERSRPTEDDSAND